MVEPVRRPRVGEIIMYRLGSGALRTVTVTYVSNDIKDGVPGFDGHGLLGDSFWGYDNQIVTYPRIRKVEVE
jgi:hypothetical protein